VELGSLAAVSTPKPFIRHRLRNHAAFWHTLTSSVFLLSIITTGLRLQWASGSPPSSFRRNQPSALAHAAFVTTAVAELVSTGAARRVQFQPHIVSPLGVAQHARTGKLRLIFDLRFGVNENLFPTPFKYEGVRSVRDVALPGDCAFGLDLSAAYHHVDIDRRYWTFLGFEWEGQFYEFCVLPFGLNIACYVFTKLVKPLAARWRKVGIRVLQYIDDWIFFVAPGAHAEAVRLVLNDCERAGWIVNRLKCTGLASPERRIDWIGHTFDIGANELRLMHSHVEHIREMGLALIASHRGVRARAVFRFVGKVCSTYHVSGRICKLHTFYLRQSVAFVVERRYEGMDCHTRLNARAVEEVRTILRLVCDCGPLGITVPLLEVAPFEPAIVIGSDAGEPGWGGWLTLHSNSFVLPRLRDLDDESVLLAQGSFTLDERILSSTLREAKALRRTLQSFIDYVSDNSVLAFVDSQNLRDIWIGGGSRNEAIHLEVLRLEDWSLRYRVRLKVVWVPRTENDLADYLSKWDDRHDWKLIPRVFQSLCRKWGPVDVDLFASHLNCQVSTFFSFMYCPGAAGVDAFTQDWGRFRLCWCHPPFKLLARVVWHARRCRANLILVAPEMPGSSWWPVLRSRDGSRWADMVVDAVELPAAGNLLLPASTGNAFGVGYPPFRIWALRVSCGP
jgi:hypothetical protein